MTLPLFLGGCGPLSPPSSLASLTELQKAWLPPNSLIVSYPMPSEPKPPSSAPVQKLRVTVTRPEGSVRLAMARGFAVYVLAPEIRSFHKEHPEIRLELLISTSLVDLSRREADIAIRFVRPLQGDLVMKRLPSAGQLCAVATKRYIADRDPNAPIQWIGWTPELENLPDAQIYNQIVGTPPTIACNDMVTMVVRFR